MGKTLLSIDGNDFENLVRDDELGILIFDADMSLRRVNDMVIEHGMISRDCVGKKPEEVNFTQEYANFASCVRKCNEDHIGISDTFILGLKFWKIQISPYLSKDMEPDGVMVIISDATRMATSEIRTKSLLKNLSVSVIEGIYTKNGLDLEYATDSMLYLLGYDTDEYNSIISGQETYLMFQEFYAQLVALSEALANDVQAPTTEFMLRHKNGTLIWIQGRAEIMTRTEDTLVVQYVLIDVTKLHEEREKLRIEKRKLAYVMEMSSDVLFEYIIQKDIMIFTRHENGTSVDNVIEHYLDKLSLDGATHSEDRELVSQFKNGIKGGKRIIKYTFRIYTEHDKKFHWYRIEGRTIYSNDGYPIKVVGRMQNADEDKEREEELTRSSERDSLTGLYNHMVCVNLVKKRMKQIKGSEKGYFAIIDVDDFKRINDENGHLYGDAVLCALSDSLKINFPTGIKGRIGGDEFLIFVDGMDESEFKTGISSVLSDVTRLGSESHNKFSLSCSVGVAVCTAKNHNYEAAFKTADQALYLIKKTGKNSYTMVNCGENILEDVHSYLAEQEPAEYEDKEETLISSDDELVVFAIEMLSNVSSYRNSLGIIADRVCSYLGFSGMALISEEENSYTVSFDWIGDKINPFERRLFPKNQQKGWQEVGNMFADGREYVTLDCKELKKLKLKGYMSAFVCRAATGGKNKNYMVFVDSMAERSWDREASVLQRLTHLLVGKVIQMQVEERNREEVEYRMNYDELTGLPSYTKFLEQASEYLERHSIDEDRDYYIVYGDYVNFNYINELYGYSIGDHILKLTGKRLQRASKHCILCSRITADQYVALMETSPEEDPCEIIEDSFLKFNDIVRMRFALCKLTILCGICKVDEPDIGISVLVDRANAARKYGKEKDKSGCILYTREMWEKNEDEKEVYVNILDALNNREFQVYLQPKISLKTGKIVGAESLVRWRRPDGTLFAPDRFIPVLEKNGFITKVDFYVLEETLRYQKAVVDEGLEPIPISVNFSRVHYDDPKFVETIMDYLNTYQVDPGLLEAEITEYNYLRDIKSLNPAIIDMQKQGVLVSIDDFGSGYSSLNILSRVTADIIKLDRMFLEDMEEQKEFLTLLTEMINKLGYQIIMEGVETEEQMKFIAGTKCDMVQGFYVAKPMPMEEFKKFTIEYNSKAKPWR